MTSVWNSNNQASSVLPPVSTPVAFAQQLDDIDKALFEYRYRKQNQQYHTTNSASQGQHHYHHNQKHQQKNGRNRNNNVNNNNFMNGNSYRQHQHFPHQVNNNKVNVTGNSYHPASVGTNLMEQQAQTQHYQPQPHHPTTPGFAVSSPDVFNNFVSRTNTLVSTPGVAPVSQGLTASSPDSFLINDDHFLGNSRLSSSVISSGGTSTSSYSSIEFEPIQNKSGFVSTPVDGKFGFPISNVNSLEKVNALGYNANKFGPGHVDEFYSTMGVRNVDPAFGSNGKAEKSPGWLNIWGSDMSVWG